MNMSVFEELDLELFNTITLVVYELQSKNKNDLFMLAKFVDEETLSKMIQFFNGCSIKFPTVEEYKESTIISMYYYLTKIKNVKFEEATKYIESLAGMKIENPHIIGKKLSKLEKELAIQTAKIINEIKDIKENG